MGNYVIAGVGNYVIENPSNLGNYVIADTRAGETVENSPLFVSEGEKRCSRSSLTVSPIREAHGAVSIAVT
jgi:hypothetical protein